MDIASGEKPRLGQRWMSMMNKESLEKQSQERTQSVWMTDMDKVNDHWFDKRPRLEENDNKKMHARIHLGDN